ncbi:sulfotransferase domain-containing protein [Candidatus Leptofilum sp.]|uniref:sulfotransferase domain-containing protein n=1 Tax=Candidatus Leptofilum sp. TaxID=3241576 RepID=UPI003B5B1991
MSNPSNRLETRYKQAAVNPEVSAFSQLAQRLLIGFGQAMWYLRPLPDFLIIGAQKAGTSSLYKYLLQHPSVLPAYQKEIHYFTIPDLYFKGERWYRGHFPTNLARGQRLTGEASPSYLFFPLVPQRVYQMMPQVKLIVLLRDPVARAFSNYHHQVRRGLETLSFEEAIAQESNRLGNDLQKTVDNPRFHSLNLAHFSYLLRGDYITQLKRWRQFFPAEQMLILKSENFYERPQEIVSEVVTFLGLPSWQPNPAIFKQYNPGDYNKMPPSLRENLSYHFQPANKALYEFLGRDLGWQ